MNKRASIATNSKKIVPTRGDTCAERAYGDKPIEIGRNTMKKSWLIVALLLVVMPLVGTAEVIRVSLDVPTVEAGVALADDGDTLLIPVGMSYSYVDAGDKDITVGVDALEPEGAIPDSTVYGPNNPFPDTPVE